MLDGAQRADAQAAAAARAALAELADPALDPVAPAELVDLLAELPVAVGERPRPGLVAITDPLAIRARRYRTVVVAGLQEGELPRLPTPDPFLDDGLRARLQAAGLPLAPRDALADERHLFYACVSRPTERLVLAYRTADEEGGLATPSFFLDDVRALYAAPIARRERPLAQVAWPPQDAPTEAERARARAAAQPPVEPPVLGSLEGEAARAALVEQPAMSASGLESYAGCPVRWLVDHHLRPRALEPDSAPLRRGSLAHRVLASASTGLRERRGSARLTPESLADALEALDAALAEHAADAALDPDPMVHAALLRGMEADLRRTLEHEAASPTALEPERFELGFGREEHDLPLVQLAEGRVTLRGQVDRVDVDRERNQAAIRDYKARDRHPVDTWERDTRLQIALYMLAVQRLLGLTPVAGLYQPLAGSDRRARGLVREDAAERVGGAVANDVKDGDVFAAALEAAEATAAALADRLARGRAAPLPRHVLAAGLRLPRRLPRRPAMTLTPEQRRAVELRDGPLLLAAGAGTGKTSVMVERFAATVLEDGDRGRAHPRHHLHREGGRGAQAACAGAHARGRRRPDLGAGRGGGGGVDHPRLLRPAAACPRARRRPRPLRNRARRARGGAPARRRLRRRAARRARAGRPRRRARRRRRLRPRPRARDDVRRPRPAALGGADRAAPARREAGRGRRRGDSDGARPRRRRRPTSPAPRRASPWTPRATPWRRRRRPSRRAGRRRPPRSTRCACPATAPPR